YKRIIEVYEGREIGLSQRVSTNGKTIYINGEAVEKYTFKQDYYWMMGDNRHRSEDSRIWGFVPFSHVVGKPVFIWMSWDSFGKKIRTERVFTTVSGAGERVSYFTYFVIALVLYFVGMFFYNKKKKQHA
ncbi:MAG: S26 family signal peptidase, partial [Flavobacteriaceae bacterium]|nr:S26 family signal peptidase [Flavobacteriaceae bacterium]